MKQKKTDPSGNKPNSSVPPTSSPIAEAQKLPESTPTPPSTDQDLWDCADACMEEHQSSEFRYPFPITVPEHWDSHLDYRYHIENFVPPSISAHYALAKFRQELLGAPVVETTGRGEKKDTAVADLLKP